MDSLDLSFKRLNTFVWQSGMDSEIVWSKRRLGLSVAGSTSQATVGNAMESEPFPRMRKGTQ
jgi:hypothetical protein